MLAIPVFRDRVAPVLDWCSKIVLISESGTGAASGRQIEEVAGMDAFTLVRTLKDRGVRVLICGALSPETLGYAESLGFRIIHGIAGEIDEILEAYRGQKLNRPQYWLPGRFGQCGRRGCVPAGKNDAGRKNRKSPACPKPGAPGTRACPCPGRGAGGPSGSSKPSGPLRCPSCGCPIDEK
ncbi:MAG: hypothetical protein ABFD98_03435 [Syntrophobacteraceae bacterium]